MSHFDSLIKASKLFGAAALLVANIAQANDAVDKTKKFLGHFDVNLNVAAPELSILKGVDMNLAYGYRVTPAYQDGLYLRIDRWTVSAPINVGDLLETFTQPVYVTVEPGAEMIFIRQFARERDALLALPQFDPRKVPFDTQHALAMKLGEAVIVPMRLNLAGGIALGDAALPITPFVDGHYFVNGLFQVQVLRLTGNFVRLRIVASRQAGHQIGAGIGSNLQLFKLAPLNSVTNLVLGENLGSINWSSARQNLFMADYIFDLGDAKARDVYNNLVTSRKVLGNVSLVDPFGHTQHERKLFVSDLSEADAIVKADLKEDHPRIRQVFKGRDIGTREGWSAQVGFTFANIGRSHTYSYDNHMIFLDGDNKNSNYYMPTDERRSSTHILWGWIDEVSTRNASVVAATGKDGRPIDLGSYALTREVKDKDLRESEATDLLREYRRMVPPEVRQQMGLDKILNEKSYDNARVYFEVIVNFNEVVNRAVGNLSADQLRLGMYVYLAAHDGDLPGAHTLDSDDIQSLRWVDAHHDDIFKMVDEMHEIFRRSSLSYQQRIERLMRLQSSDVFRTLGTGFLTSLIPPRDLPDVIKVSTMISAKNLRHTVTANYGHSPAAEVVHVSQYIQNLLSNGGFDVRLESFGQDPKLGGQVVSMRDIARRYDNKPVPTFQDDKDN